jgi:hypothetical protein
MKWLLLYEDPCHARMNVFLNWRCEGSSGKPHGPKARSPLFVTDAEGLRDGCIDRYKAQPKALGAIQVTVDVPGMNLSYSQVESERTATRGRAVDHIGFEVEGLVRVCVAVARLRGYWSQD